MRYINRFKKSPFLNAYDPCFIYEKKSPLNEPSLDEEFAFPFMLNSNLKKPYPKSTKNLNLTHKLNFNVAPQFTPKTNISLFLKKLFKSEDFDLQQVLSPSFLQTPYIGVDFSEGFDPKFHSNPNRSIANYFKKGCIQRHYTKASNYIYKPYNLTNLKSASLCLSILHEKVNIDETYLDDLFSTKAPVKLKKRSVKEFRRLTSFKSRKALKMQLLSTNQTTVNSSDIPTIPEKLDLSMAYNLGSVDGCVQHESKYPERKYNIGLNKFISIKEITITPDDV